MKKAIIEFNGVEKIVDITDEFHTEIRIINDFAEMSNNQLLKEILSPKINRSESEVVKQYQTAHEKFTQKLIDFIQDKFSVKINTDFFHYEEYNVTDEKLLKENIVLIYEASDIEIEI